MSLSISKKSRSGRWNLHIGSVYLGYIKMFPSSGYAVCVENRFLLRAFYSPSFDTLKEAKDFARSNFQTPEDFASFVRSELLKKMFQV